MDTDKMLEEMPPGFTLHRGKKGWSIVYSNLTHPQYKNGLNHLKPPFVHVQFETHVEAIKSCADWLKKNLK